MRERMKRRPLIVTVFGVANVGLGAWAVNAALTSWRLWFELRPLPGVALSPAFSRAVVVHHVVVNSLLIVGCICMANGLGLLLNHAWSRITLTATAFAMIGMYVMRKTSHIHILVEVGQGSQLLAHLLRWGSLQFDLMYFVYPILLLYAMRRMDVRMAFAGAVPATVEEGPVSEPRT